MHPSKSVRLLIRISTSATLFFVACYVTVLFHAQASVEITSQAATPSRVISNSDVTSGPAPVTLDLQNTAAQRFELASLYPAAHNLATMLDDNVIACFSVGNALSQKVTFTSLKDAQPIRNLGLVLMSSPLPTNLNVVHTKAVANLPQAPPLPA